MLARSRCGALLVIVKGLPVLIVEQNIDLVQTVAQRAYVLDKGTVVAKLERGELESTERVAANLAV